MFADASSTCITFGFSISAPLPLQEPARRGKPKALGITLEPMLPTALTWPHEGFGRDPSEIAGTISGSFRFQCGVVQLGQGSPVNYLQLSRTTEQRPFSETQFAAKQVSEGELS